MSQLKKRLLCFFFISISKNIVLLNRYLIIPKRIILISRTQNELNKKIIKKYTV